jgi:hypothetical protein
MDFLLVVASREPTLEDPCVFYSLVCLHSNHPIRDPSRNLKSDQIPTPISITLKSYGTESIIHKIFREKIEPVDNLP